MVMNRDGGSGMSLITITPNFHGQRGRIRRITVPLNRRGGLSAHSV